MIEKFKMTEEDFCALHCASEKVKSIEADLELAGMEVNRLWESLGKKMGFYYETARQAGADNKEFYANSITKSPN